MHDPTTNLTHASRSAAPMLWIGERCHLEICHREDFLPFKCKDCHENFCVDHYKPDLHSCPSASSSRSSADFYVPLCPLCHEPPTGWKRDEDPNIAMERHLSARPRSAGACKALGIDGMLKDEQAPQMRAKVEKECRFRKCRKIMVVPITCQKCRQSFCPSHRAPQQHECSTSANASASSSKSGSTVSLPSSSSIAKSGSSRAKSKAMPSSANAVAANAAATIKAKVSALGSTRSNSSGATQPYTTRTVSSSAAPSKAEATPPQQASAPNAGSSTFNFFDKTDKWVPRPLFAQG
ncbi:hypothetical protein K437DRAFT_258048 [Tilletiaria anomala UBC 951]|uniref:AN1-type domain-containing protein n=1 Tax=Tilletiaria anomala (strain ATCC 24038 / CBS 436.72 / UBC 951) TaxID=1037660 RepID=A0A066VTT1_TILAU|nr:uncharacterized protein K437DRAFT_258048 [Tilletiaria anomala UBC 951]KDN41965.1 hypothetical protein K437DRAFT_258048 [Tilletiaria anomala UBC 951]